MQEHSQRLNPETAVLIEQTVREVMEPFGLRSVTSSAGLDHDGDPVIHVEARYDLSEQPIDPAVTARLALHLRERLWAAGETRFPHIRHYFDERQKVIRSRRTKR